MEGKDGEGLHGTEEMNQGRRQRNKGRRRQERGKEGGRNARSWMEKQLAVEGGAVY